MKKGRTMESMGESFLKQLNFGTEPNYDQSSSSNGSKRFKKKKECDGLSSKHHNGNNMNAKKRVIVVIDDSASAKHAMMWALTHVTNTGDLLTLLHVLPPIDRHAYSPNLADSLGSLCNACKPEVEVEALVIQGPKLATVLSQVKKLEASVLVLSQSKPSAFSCYWKLFKSRSEEFVEQCIKRAACLTLAVRKQSKGIGGYLVTTRWQKNFWLLAKGCLMLSGGRVWM